MGFGSQIEHIFRFRMLLLIYFEALLIYKICGCTDELTVLTCLYALEYDFDNWNFLCDLYSLSSLFFCFFCCCCGGVCGGGGGKTVVVFLTPGSQLKMIFF